MDFCVPYFAIGLNSAADRFFTGAAIEVLVANSAVSFGYFVSCLAGTTPIALAIAGPLNIPLLLFGGFFLKNNTAPKWLEFFKYLSWFNYGNEALTINQWRDVEFTTPGPNCNSTMLEYTAADPNAFICNGNDVIALYNFNPVNMICHREFTRKSIFIFLFLGLLSSRYSPVGCFDRRTKNACFLGFAP